MKSRIIAVALLAALLAGCRFGAGADGQIVDNSAARAVPVEAIRALTCKVKTQHFATLGERFKSVNRGGDTIDLTFTELDWEKGQALLIGNQGAARVAVWRVDRPAPPQLIFIEQVPLGSVTVTSVFLSPADEDGAVKSGQASAIHSRHIAIPGSREAAAMATQMTGVCDLKL